MSQKKDFMDLNDDEISDWLDNRSDSIFHALDFRYCISCERITAVLDGINGEFHTVVNAEKGEFFVDSCHGPFALSTPPDNLNPDWDLTVEEPSQEELAEMNLEAERLLQELE